VTLVGNIQSALCIVVVTTLAFFLPLADYQLRSHIRRNHPRVWRRFGFPSVSSFSVPWKNEREALIADIGFGEFFSRGQYTALNDPLLNTLWQRKRALRRIGGVAMALMAVNFWVFRTAPDFSWIIR
jgi:hypothetical protein